MARKLEHGHSSVKTVSRSVPACVSNWSKGPFATVLFLKRFGVISPSPGAVKPSMPETVV